MKSKAQKLSDEVTETLKRLEEMQGNQVTTKFAFWSGVGFLLIFMTIMVGRAFWMGYLT